MCAASESEAEVQVYAEATQVALQRSVAPSLTSTVAPVSHAPETSGVASARIAAASGAVIVGSAGAAVSTVNVRPAEATPTLAARSVWRAVKVCAPSARAIDSHVNAEATHVAEQIAVAPSKTSTSALVSQEPETAGVASIRLAPASGVSRTGASGGVESKRIWKVRGADSALTFPAPSTARAVTVTFTSPYAAVLVHDQALATHAEVQSTAAPSSTVTVEPASHVPTKAGFASFVIAAAAGVVTTGIEGGVPSSVKLRTALFGPTALLGSVWKAKTACGPSARLGEQE